MSRKGIFDDFLRTENEVLGYEQFLSPGTGIYDYFTGYDYEDLLEDAKAINNGEKKINNSFINHIVEVFNKLNVQGTDAERKEKKVKEYLVNPEKLSKPLN